MKGQIKKKIQANPLLRSSHEVSKELGIEIFLVGGAVRDLILGRDIGKNLDFALSGDIQKFVKVFARSHKKTPIPFSHGVYRVVIRRDGDLYEMDFSLLQGSDIIEDLSKRDFTFNSIAINLHEAFEKSGKIRLIDPLGGKKDLEKGILRASDPSSFQKDPLRILRAVRLCAQYKTSIEPDALKCMLGERDKLNSCSPERIRSEFFLILDTDHAFDAISYLLSYGIFELIIPEVQRLKGIPQTFPHNYDLLTHSLKTLQYMEEIERGEIGYLSHFQGMLTKHYQERLEKDIKRGSFLKFISLFHDIGKPTTFSLEEDRIRFLGHEREGAKISNQIAKRWKFSKRATRSLVNIIKNHMRPLNLSASPQISKRAKFRFFRDMGDDGIDTLILALADALATRETREKEGLDLYTPIEEMVENFLEYYLGEFQETPKIPLLTGNEIMNILQIPPGKEVGRILEEIMEAERNGLISNRKEAINLLSVAKL